MAAIETDIKAAIERQGRRLTLREVRCPEDVTPQAGAHFRCVGELEPEGTFTINVIQEDAQGNVTWEVPNSRVILNLARVEANIQEGLTKVFSKRVLVDCGSELYRANQPGDRFECAIVGGLKVGAEAFDSVLVRVDTNGNLNWQERRQNNLATVAAETVSASTSQPTAPVSSTVTMPASTSAAPAPDSVKTTTVTGPAGREIKRPYVSGDDD